MRFSKAIRQASNTLAVASVAFMAAATAPAQRLNWDGQTGIYVTPLAYVSGSPAGKAGKPSVGYHFLNGGSVLGNWSSISVTEGLAGRMEVGYTRTMMSAGSDKALSPLWDGGFNVVHAKGVLVTENLNKHNWVPAI